MDNGKQTSSVNEESSNVLPAIEPSLARSASSAGPVSAKHVTLVENDTILKVDMPSSKPLKTSSSFTGPFRGLVRQKSTTSGHGLSIYDEDTSTMPTIASYLRRFTIPGPIEEDESGSTQSKRKKTKLGTLLGVYLPTIQHILGVQMFLRLVWIVGVGGVVESFAMIFICCLCTFLTSISISAIATNGVIDSGGAYFMISRNLGPEFGGAIGVLYYLANAVATAMYLVGGVEILLMYIAPDLPQFGDPNQHNEADLFNNFRVYATGLLLLEFVVVAMGVKFVQFFAPISLACVVVSILSVYIGAFVANPESSPMLCMLGDRLLKPSTYSWPNGTEACNKDIGGPVWTSLCSNGTCDPYLIEENISYVPGIPGFFDGIIKDNLWSAYLSYGEAAPGQTGDSHREVTQDISTTFFIILAIFFPSVTGIFTGANMSGDLKDAQKSLPIGTIAAQLTTSFVYLSFVVVFGGTIHGALLRDKYGDSLNRSMVVAELAWPNPWVLLVGSFTSTFGAALQCLCSAPRLLQSISKDDVVPILRPFSVVTKRGEPIRALFLSTFIAEIAVLIGGIDYIAPVVDFFFLMCYCFVNIVCALQTLLNVPNWRPRFQFYHWSLSLIGAILCLFIMFSTYWYFALVVLALCGFIYKYIEYKGAKKEWGDGLGGLALSTAQFSLLRVEESHMHPKNWRPQLLVLVKLSKTEQEANEKLLQLSGQLKAGQGLTIVATLIEGDSRSQQDRERAELDRQRLKRLMEDHKVKGFAQVVLCQHAYEIVGTLIQCIGIGGLRPNTVMVNWPTHWKDNLAKHDAEHWNFLDAIHRAAAMDICLLVPKGIEKFPEPNERLTGTVDVWWIMHDGGLLILLPFLMKQHKVWRQCKLRIFAVAQLHDNSVKMKQDLQRWVYQLRIDCTVDVVEFADNAISAYTYERTMMMEERHKLAHDYKLTRMDIEHEPQMLADRSRSFLNLRGLDGNMQRSPSGHGDSHFLHPDVNPSTPQHESVLSAAVKRVGFKLSISRAPKPARLQEMHPTIKTGEECAGEDANEKSPLTADTPIKEEDGKKRVLFHIAPHKAPDYFDSAEPSSPTTPGQVEDYGDNDGPSEFTFSPRDWADELRRHSIASVDWVEDKADSVPEIRIGSPTHSMDISSAQAHGESTHTNVDSKFANLDKKKVRKMHSAVKLNRAIRERSADSQLVVMNLPRPPRIREGLGNYMEYLEAMTDGLERVLLVRGTGREVITIYS